MSEGRLGMLVGVCGRAINLNGMLATFFKYFYIDIDIYIYIYIYLYIDKYIYV